MTSSINASFLGTVLPHTVNFLPRSRHPSTRILPRPHLLITCRSTSRVRRVDERKSKDDGGPLLNEDIRSPTVRLLDQDQKMVGTCSRIEALTRAREAGLDLVMVSEDADPPVVRIVDYRKFKFDQQKRKKEAQKKAAANRTETKELKMRYNIDTHDYDVKVRAAQSFLADGDRVKLLIIFRGREMEFRESGFRLIERFIKDVGEIGSGDSKPIIEGRSLTVQIAPNKAFIMKSKSDKVKGAEKGSVSESADGDDSEEQEGEETVAVDE